MPDALVEAPDAVHDFMIFPWQAEEASVIYEHLDAWLRELLSRDTDESEEPISDSAESQPHTASYDAQKPDLRCGKSPVMIPSGDVRGVFHLMGEMRSEGMR